MLAIFDRIMKKRAAGFKLLHHKQPMMSVYTPRMNCRSAFVLKRARCFATPKYKELKNEGGYRHPS
jgi:hypothetical protein